MGESWNNSVISLIMYLSQKSIVMYFFETFLVISLIISVTKKNKLTVMVFL